VKEDIELKMKIDTLTKKVDALVVSKSINVVNPFHVDCCSICASPMHLAQTCPSLSAFVESPMEQVNAFNDFSKQSNGPFSEERDAEPSTTTPTIEIPPRSFAPKAPYLDRLLTPKKEGKFEDILEVFKHM
jgi:hypothetical protein